MKRSIYLDNLKFVLIYFVVLGHFANLNRDIPVFGVMNNIIYSFHMPLFIFVSGYLSRNINGHRKKELDQVLYTYFVFEIINFIFTRLTKIGSGGPNIFIPTAQNWYLLGIFFWRLFLPYCRLFKRSTSFVAAVVIALMIGFNGEFNTFLGLYRIIYFMPFFLLGSFCNDIDLLIDKYVRYRLYFIIFLIVSFSIIAIISLHGVDFNKAIAYAFTPYKGYGSESMNELCLRFFLRVFGFASSIIISFCFIFLIPNKKTVYTNLGKNTLNVYLLHMFVVYTINWLFEKYKIDVALMVQISILTSFLVTISLSSNFVDTAMAPFTKGSKMISISKFRTQKTCGGTLTKG